MASLNRVTLIGHIGREIEVRHTAAGIAVATFTLATSEKIKNKAGDWEDKTEWHNIVLWAKLAELAGQFLSKGKLVYIEGRLQTRKWQDKEGKDRYSTEIIGERMQLLSPKDGGSRGAGNQNADHTSTGGNENDPEPDYPF